MLNALILAMFALAAVLAAAFVALCLAIRHEDRSPSLTTRPPSASAAIVRRIAGLSVRRLAGPADAPADDRLALSGPSRPDDLEGR